MIIYKVENKITKKVYIGQTKFSLNRRKTQHIIDCNKNNDNIYFYNAIRKYGIDSFEWKILCECKTKEELDEMEFHFIKQYNSLSPYGYNLTLGGEGTHGYKFSDAQKRKISKKLTGRILSEETKKKISEAHLGIPLTKEHRLKVSKGRKGKGPKNISFEHKKKIGDAVRGQKRSNETKQKMRINQLGKNNSFYGRRHDIEIIKTKMSHFGKDNPFYDKQLTKEQYEKKSRTIFYISDIEGNIITTKVLKIWCDEHNIKGSSLDYFSSKGDFYQGYKIIKKEKFKEIL